MSKKSKLTKLNNKLHLTKYGYNIHSSNALRYNALHNAIADNNPLLVWKQLNLIRDNHIIPEYKQLFSEDAKYIKKYINQKGGAGILEDEMAESSETDEVINGIEIQSPTVIQLNTIIDREKVCDGEGKCGVRNVVYEVHYVNGKEVEFRTLDMDDADSILELDIKYYDSDEKIENVVKKIMENAGLMIGIIVDGLLEGYCLYSPFEENLTVEIVWFCANKGNGTPLYHFMEKYFQMADYQKVIIVVSLEDKFAVRRINFWYKMGFTTYQSIPEKYKIHLEKIL